MVVISEYIIGNDIKISFNKVKAYLHLLTNRTACINSKLYTIIV